MQVLKLLFYSIQLNSFLLLKTPFSALADWDETLSWSDERCNEIYTDKTPYDRNYLLALHSFDMGDFTGIAKHLENVSDDCCCTLSLYKYDSFKMGNWCKNNQITRIFELYLILIHWHRPDHKLE